MLVARSPFEKGFMIVQLDFFQPVRVFPQNDIQKLICSFAFGGNMPRALELFRREFMDSLRLARGNIQDGVVQQIADFGKNIFGEDVHPVFAECVNAIAREIEMHS